MGKLADKKKKIEQDKQRTTSTNGRRQAENRGYTGGTKPAQSSSGSASSSGSKPASSVSAAPQKTTASASSGQGLKLPTSTEKLRTTNPTQIILEAAARAKADELEREKRYYSGVNMAPPTNGRGFSTTPKQMTGLNGMTALESLQAAAFMKNEKNQSASELRRTASGMDDNSAGRQKLLDTAGFIRNLSPYDQKLPDAQRNAIVVQKNQWNAAQDYIDYLQKLREEFVADGYDPSGIDSAIAQTKAAQRRIHDTADLARAHSGYTGGSDGSQFHKWNLSPEYTNVSSDNANWAPTARAAAGNDTFDIEEYKGAGADRETWIDPTWRLKEEMARNEATAEQLRKMGYGFHADNIMKDVAEVAAQQANPDSGDQRAQNLMLSAVNRVRGSLMSFGALASQAAKNAAANNDRLGPVYNYTIKMRRAEDALRKAKHQGDEEGIKKYEAEIEKYKTLIYGGQKYIPGTDGELTESYKNRAIADTPGVSERGHELLEESRHQMALAKRGLGGWGQFAMETAGVGLENIPTMAMFALAPPAGAAYMGATVLGEKGDEFSRNEFGAVEYSAQEALLKAFPYAVVETATEAAGDSAILSFINRRGSLGLGGVVARAALTEGAEEGAAGILDYGLDALYGNPAVRGYSFERIMRDILKQSAQGAIIGGIMGAGGAVIAGRIGSSEEQIDPEWYNKVDTSPLGSYSERFGRNRWMPGTSDYFEVRQFIQDEVDRRNAEALGSDYMNETPVRYDPRTWGQDMNILVDMYREGGITDKEWREIAFDDDLVSVLEDTAERKMESGSRVEWVKKTIDELANIQAEYNGGRTIERSEPYGSLSRGISDENANAASEILRNETTGERGGIARSGAADALIRAAGGDVKANVYDVEKRAAELAEKGGTEKGADIVSMVDRAGKPASVRMEEENEVSEPVSILDMAKKSKEPAYVRLDEEDTGSETVDIRSMVQPAKTAEPVVDGDITDYEYTDDDVPAENNDSRTAEDMAENTYEGMSDEEIADTLNSIYQEQIKAGDAAVDETENAADIIRNALPEMDEATEREVITGVIDAIESISQKDGVPWTKTDIEKFAKRAYDDIVRSKEEETKESPAVSEQSDESSDGSKRASLESAIRAAHEGITDEQISEVMGYVSDDMLNSKSTDDIVKMLEPGIKGVMEAGREGTEAEAELDKRTINEKLSDPKYNPLEDETLKGSYLLRAVSKYFGSLSDPMRNVMIDMYERDNDAPMERTDVIDYYRQFVSIVGAYNDLTLAKERGRGDDVTAGAVWEKVFLNNYDNPLFNEKDVRKILREIEKISKEEKEEEQEERKPLESEFLRYMDDDSPDMFLKDENGYLPVVPHPTDEDVTTQDNVIGYSEIIRKGFKYRDYDSIMVTKTDKDAVMTMLRSVPELRAEFGTNWSEIKETLAISEELKKEFTPFIECEWQDDLEDGSSTYYVRALVYAPVNENESDKKIRTGEDLYESGRKKPPKVKNTEYTEAKVETEEQESAPKAEKPGPFLDRYGILAPQFVRRHFNSVGTGIKNGVYETYQELLFIYDEMLSEGIVKKETVRKRLEDVAKRIEKIQKDEINDPRMQAIHGFLRDRGLRLTESDIRSTADLDKIKAEYRDSKRLKITEADYKRDSSGNKVYYTGGDFNKKGHRTPNVDVYWEDLIREFNDIGIVRYYEEEVENKREDIIPAIIAICDAVWSAKDNFVSADTIIDSLVEDYISSYEYIEKFGDRYGYRDDDELPFDKVSETSEKPEKQKKQTQKPKKAEKQDGPGLVMDDYVRANVSRAEQKRLDESAKALGVTIRFVDEVNGGASNAQYDNGVVLIEKNNPNPTLFLYGHEITHHLEDTAPDAHKRLKKYLKNQGDFRKRLADMKELYRSKGYQVTDEYLENEVIADMVGELIENEDILKRFIKANRKNQNFLQKIFAAFRSLLAKLGGTGRSAKVAKACRLIEDAIDASVASEIKKNAGARESIKKAAQVARNKVIPEEGKYTLSDARAWFDALNSDEENVALADRVFGVLSNIEKDTGKQFSVYVAKTRRMLPGYRYAAGVSAGSNVALNTLFFSRPILAFAEIVGGDRGSDTILHELIHSATWYALEMVEFEDYRVSPEIQAFYDEVSEIYSIVKKNKMLFNPMFSYGLTNKYEMLAQLSAEQFRNVLRTISTEKGNALQRIINAIAGFFGIRTKAVENNMLDRLYAALDRIIENYDAELFAAFESEYFEDGGAKLMLNSDFVDSLNQAGETGVRNSLKSDVNSQNEDSSEGEEEEWPTNGKPMDTIPPRFDEVYHNYVSPMERHGIKDGDYVSASTITEIFKELTDDEYQINLYNNVFSALDKIGAMPTFRFYSELPDKVIGRYHYDFHRVEYSAAYYGERRFKSGLNAKLHEEMIANAILHELIHALTFHVINRLDSSKVSDETLEILGKISQEIREAYDELVSDENFKDIYLYGRKNVDEFLAELSNPRFREILSNISHKRFGYDHLAFKRDLEIEAARNKTVDDVIHKTPILRDFLNGNEKATEIVRKILIFLAKTFEAFANLNYNFIAGKAVYLTEDYDAALFREKHAIGETPYYSGIQEEDNLLSFLEAAIGAIAQNTNESIYVKYMETQEPSKSGARNSLKTSQFKQWGVTDSEVTRNPDNTQTGKTITEIVDWVQTQIGVQVTTGQMRGMPKTVRGYYRNSDQAIRTRINNNLPTITHELGHWLDDMTSRKTGGKIGDFSNSLSEEARKELIENTDVVARYQNEGERVQVSEGFAEFIREFLKSKASAQAKFPTVYKELYNSVDARQMQQLDYLADMVNDYMTSPADLSNAIRRRNDRVDTRTRKQKTEERAHQIYQTWVDTNHAIEILTRETGDRSPYIAATNAAYAAHRAGAIITRNMYSLDGTTLVGPSLKHALEGAGLNMKDEKKAKEEYDAFGTYLVAKHGPERILEGAERSGKGRVIADDRMNDIAFLDKTAAELEEKYPHFKQAAEALYQFQKDFLYEYAVGSGIISKKTADEWQDRWDFYVPFQRYMADGKGTDSSASRGFANQVAGIYKFKGSGRDIIHPVDSVIGFVTRMTTVAVMNDVMSQLTDSVVRYGLEARWMERVQTPEDVVKVSTESFKKKVLKFIDDQMDFEEWEEDDVQEFKDGLMALDDEIAKYMQGKPHGNVVSVYKNGKAEFWKVNDKMLLESLTSMQPKTMDGVLAMAATVTRFMTSNITGRNVVWSIMSNMPRDIVTALVFSKNHNPAEVIGGMVRNYANFIAGDKANNQYFDEFIAMGGGQVTSWNADIDNSSKIQRQMGWLTDYSAADTNILQKGGRKVKGVGVGFISALDQISSAIESGPRFAEYESLRKQDVSPQDAFYAAMDVTTNFARHGRMSQGVNYLVPFFNASVQGIDKFSRWIRATDVEGTRAERQQASIGRMLVWAGASMLLAAMIYGFNNRDDENKKYYQMLSNYTKNNYFCLSLGDGRFRTIPKPREIAVLESFFESAMEYAHGGNKEAFNEFYDYATEQLIPPAVSPILKADVNGLLSDFGLFGALAAINGNRDFLGNPIESRSFDSSNTPINDRMNSNTSVMAKWIADIIAASDIIPEKAKENASPLKIDYFLKQVLGGFWKTPANIFPIGDEYKEENKAAFIAAGLGRAIGGNYTKDALYSNDLINWIYDYKTEQARKGNEGTGDFDAEFNAKLVERYTDFYGRFYGLTKNASNSDEVRQLRKSVLDTMIQFKKQAENDMFPAYIEELRKVAQDQSEKKIGDLMPMVFEKEIKDANGEKHLLTGAQYYELQTRYNSYYAEGVQAILANDELSANEKAAGIDRMKDDISARAKREILEMIGAPTSAVTTAASGKESTTYIDKWGPFYSKMSTGEMAGLRVSVSAQTSWYTPEHNAITNSQSVKMAKAIVDYGLNLSEDDTVALMDAFGVSKTVIESYKNGGLNDMYSALEEQYNNSWADYNENNGG